MALGRFGRHTSNLRANKCQHFDFRLLIAKQIGRMETATFRQMSMKNKDLAEKALMLYLDGMGIAN
jgi:hypothetical protein